MGNFCRRCQWTTGAACSGRICPDVPVGDLVWYLPKSSSAFVSLAGDQKMKKVTFSNYRFTRSWRPSPQVRGRARGIESRRRRSWTRRWSRSRSDGQRGARQEQGRRQWHRRPWGGEVGGRRRGSQGEEEGGPAGAVGLGDGVVDGRRHDGLMWEGGGCWFGSHV